MTFESLSLKTKGAYKLRNLDSVFKITKAFVAVFLLLSLNPKMLKMGSELGSVVSPARAQPPGQHRASFTEAQCLCLPFTCSAVNKYMVLKTGDEIKSTCPCHMEQGDAHSLSAVDVVDGSLIQVSVL